MLRKMSSCVKVYPTTRATLLNHKQKCTCSKKKVVRSSQTMDTEHIRLLAAVFSTIAAVIKIVQKMLELFRDNPRRKLPKHKKPRSVTKRCTH